MSNLIFIDNLIDALKNKSDVQPYIDGYESAKFLWNNPIVESHSAFVFRIMIDICVIASIMFVLSYIGYLIFHFIRNTSNNDGETEQINKYIDYYPDYSIDRAERIILTTYRTKNMIALLLGVFKIGGIVTMLVATAIYQYRFRTVFAANTIFSAKPIDIFRYCVAIFFSGICGSISILCTLLSRHLMNKSHIKTIVSVGLIFSLFELTIETSGFNRYMNKVEIENGHGNYASSDGTELLNQTGLQAFALFEQNTDPFITSLIYTFAAMAMFILTTFIATILISIFIRWNKHRHFSIGFDRMMWKNAQYSINSKSFIINEIDRQPKQNLNAFMTELLLFSVVLPAIPFIIREGIINGHDPSITDIMCGLIIGICGGCLHVVLQYTGYLSNH